ncbi:MAG: S8 family peptidase [Oscillospiraceae bacterium]|nr:S8 family peptidase [Oscillospiraceae bacterium]
MADIQSIQKFLDSPDTVGFVVRGGNETDRLISENPDIIVTQTLAGRYVVCYTTVQAYPQIVEQLGTSYLSSIAVVLGPLGRPALEKAGILSIQQQPYLNLRGQGVLIGFVDTGIDYTQQIFRYEDGTSKIRYLYDQSITSAPPEGFFIGTEYTNEQINQALKAENPFDVVPSRDTAGHGTFLASVAAGREEGDFIGAAPDAELIVVKLKRARPYGLELFAVPKEQENAFSSIAVMIGVEYIVRKAQALNRPVVICLGIGTNSGSHDGFSIFEEYLSEIANLPGVCLCIAAGNESQARHHTKGIIEAKGEAQSIDVKVSDQPSDFLISVWNSMADKMSVSILSPTGEYIARIPPKTGSVQITDLILERAQVRVACYFPLEGSGGQLTTVRVLGAPPGIWTITMHGDIILDGTFHAWLPLTGFVSPNVEFLAANPYYTVTVPSTASIAINCGAYDSSNDSLYLNTSWGPTRIERMAPDLVAPGVGILGIYPTGSGTMSGTSAATAITAGACALMMQWGIVQKNDVSISTYQIRAYLIRGCSRLQNMSYPNPQWGYGTLDLFQSFNLMREQ